MEKTKLYKLISQATPESLKSALLLVDRLTEEQVRMRHETSHGTWYHHMTNMAAKVREKCGGLNPILPLIYKLALRGININAQNDNGNTCLHLACIKPRAEELCEHFIKVGADPCIMNNKGCRVIHTVRNHECVLVKGQASAKSGIWSAVEKEDVELTRRLLRSWVRVKAERNKSLHMVCDETGNLHICKLLQDYELTNEMMMYALAGDAAAVKDMLKAGGVDLSLRDESRDVPRPIINVVMEFGEVCKEVVQVLQDYGMDPSEYQEKLLKRESQFEEELFYQRVEEGTEESLDEALSLIAELDITLTSRRIESLGWNYLHYVIHKYNNLDRSVHGEIGCCLIRLMYRLALAGVDINLRDGKGNTPLIAAAANQDQELMTHIIRLGGDSSLTSRDGRAVHMEVYKDKGKLVFDKNYRHADLPGLWVAVSTNDVKKAERWLKSWSRVSMRRGDRRVIDVARAMGRDDLVKLMETYMHINEFVCATFSCNNKSMMDLLALGKGIHKVNTIDDFFHVGYTWDRHAEFMQRPIIIAALEICRHDVVDFLLRFGADLSRQYEESYPCGPTMFHAFRDHVDSRNALVVCNHADVNLQDETGCTMLHRVVQRKQSHLKREMVQVLLDRSINIAARDLEGSTARDYIDIHDIEDRDVIRQLIDNHVMDLVSKDLHDRLENLIVESYDHITDIRSEKRNKSPLEVALSKEYKEIIHLLQEYDQYKDNIATLHKAAEKGDLFTISKLSTEKRCAFSKDLAGRTLLHNAVLYGQPDIVKFLVEQQPTLVNSLDNLLRTPLHYCVCLEDRHNIWPILQDVGADPNLVDANGLSVYDYIRELEGPTDVREKPRGRRHRNYKPAQLISHEREYVYGSKAAAYALRNTLVHMLQDNASLADIKSATQDFSASLALDDLDNDLLRVATETKRTEIVKHLIDSCGARHDALIKLSDGQKVPLVDFADQQKLDDLVEYLRTKSSQSQTAD